MSWVGPPSLKRVAWEDAGGGSREQAVDAGTDTPGRVPQVPDLIPAPMARAKSYRVGNAAQGIAHSHRAVGQPHGRDLGDVAGNGTRGWVT